MNGTEAYATQSDAVVPGRKSSRFNAETLLALALVTPSIVAILIFVYGFIAWSVRVSLSQWVGLLPDYSWAGLSNYTNLLLNDPRFQIDIRNTVIFTVAFVSGCLLVGLALAILLDHG
ncbi:MAG: carbohydrate ABC transporter permease, partial [Ardenticatenaceae bacterium]